MHWYSKDGKPQHFIEGKNGERPTTLRDARALSLLPSVTGILDTLDKPALTSWKMRQVLTAALTLPAIDGEDVDAFYQRVMNDAFTESSEARDRGSEIHKAMEGYWLKETMHPDEDIWLIANMACESIAEYCCSSDFIPEKIVVGEGFGGMVDLHNDQFCIDYKTKDIKDSDWERYCGYKEDQKKEPPQGVKPPKLAYPEMCMQLSAYDKALGGNPRKLINVFVDRNIPGRVIIWEWEENMYDRFELLLKYWCLSKGYFP